MRTTKSFAPTTLPSWRQPGWRRYLLTVGIAAAILLLVWFGLRHDAGLYSRQVAQVESVRTTAVSKLVDDHDNKDAQVRQQVRARLLNGKHKGQVVHFTNSYTRSQAIDFPLRTHQQVFLSKSQGSYQLSDAKRDSVSGVLLALVLILLFTFTGLHAFQTLAAIALNTGIFMLGINGLLKSHGNWPWYIVGILAVVFTIATALLIIGPRRVGFSIGLATLLSTLLAVGLGYGIMTAFNYRGIHIEEVRYVTQNPRLIFFAQIVIGALGAVLDETSDISVAVFQLPADAKVRFQAGMAIGRKIMGPLIAVLFMIFMADTFAESILWLRNGNTIAYTVSWVMGLGFAQSLISAFGIVLAVPITSGLAALLAGKKVAA